MTTYAPEEVDSLVLLAAVSLADHIPGLMAYTWPPGSADECGALVPYLWHGPASRPHAVVDIIPHLNDSHGWSRERIADWLDTLPNMEVHQDAVNAAPPKEEVEAAQAVFDEALDAALKEGQ